MQCDVSKYFDSIDHKILLAIVKKKIIDPVRNFQKRKKIFNSGLEISNGVDSKTLRLLEEIINSGHSRKVFENLFDYRLTGIPIGNLTSQMFANIYLNELDQFIKHKLREKFYIRYMDDFLILNHDKKMLQNLKQMIKEFLSERLALTLHPKKANIFPVDRGVDFLGYRIFRHYRLLRKSTIKRFVKKMRKYREKDNKEHENSVRSWLAYAKFGNTQGLRRKMGLPL